mmetsp:Transcript_20590/g.48008  ORF Transcript_20590/g.48008 Transcript_20590/m.48008 type:complete len:226 (-) Transcript_20590:1044-1721(-)
MLHFGLVVPILVHDLGHVDDLLVAKWHRYLDYGFDCFVDDTSLADRHRHMHDFLLLHGHMHFHHLLDFNVVMTLLNIAHRHVYYLLPHIRHGDVHKAINRSVLNSLLRDDLWHMDNLLHDVFHRMLDHSGHLHQLLDHLNLRDLLDDLVNLHVRHLDHLLLNLATDHLLRVLLRDLRSPLHLFGSASHELWLCFLGRRHHHCMVLGHRGILVVLYHGAGHRHLPH